MCEEVPCFGETSHKLTVMLFSSMMDGTKYTRRANTETTIYFIVNMGKDYGKDRMVNALQATHDNIKYYYEQTGNQSHSIRRGCKKVAVAAGLFCRKMDGRFCRKKPDTDVRRAGRIDVAGVFCRTREGRGQSRSLH